MRLFFIIILIMSLPMAASWLDCTPDQQCDHYYTDEGVECGVPNATACTRTCNLTTTGCYGEWYLFKEDLNNYGNGTRKAYCDYYFDPDNDSDDCTGTSCYTDYCYKLEFDIEAYGYNYSEPTVYMEQWIDVSEDITVFGDDRVFYDSSIITLNGIDKVSYEGNVYIYGNNYSFTSNGTDNDADYEQGYFTAIDDYEGIHIRARVPDPVVWVACEFDTYMYQRDYRTMNTEYLYCDKINEHPELENCSNGFLLNNAYGSTVNIDLYDCHDDPDGSDSASTFTILNESNTTLIDCYIVGDRNITCNNPNPNYAGTSEITVQAEDLYNNTDTTTIYVTTWDPPEGENTRIIPENPTLADDLVCEYDYIMSPLSKLQEQETTYYWWISGEYIYTGTNNTLSKDNLALNQSITCIAHASDGRVNGSWSGYTNYISLSETVSNVSLNLSELPVWNATEYYHDITNIELTQILQAALDNCSADDTGFCNISIDISSTTNGSIYLSELEIFYSKPSFEISINQLTSYNSGLTKLYKFEIANTGDETIYNISYGLNTGEDTINSTELFNLSSGESIIGLVTYTYSQFGEYNATLNVTGYQVSDLLTTSVSVYNATDIIESIAILEDTKTLHIIKTEITSGNNITFTWNATTSNITVQSQNINISNETITILFEHNYSSTGTYTFYLDADYSSDQLPVIINNITLDNLRTIDSNQTIWSFEINYLNSTDSSYYIFNTGTEEVNSSNFNSSVLCLYEHDYSGSGTYAVNASVNTLSKLDIEQLYTNVGG